MWRHSAELHNQEIKAWTMERFEKRGGAAQTSFRGYKESQGGPEERPQQAAMHTSNGPAYGVFNNGKFEETPRP